MYLKYVYVILFILYIEWKIRKKVLIQDNTKTSKSLKFVKSYYKFNHCLLKFTDLTKSNGVS